MIQRTIAAFLFCSASFCAHPEISKKNILNIVSTNHAIQAIISGYLYKYLWENSGIMTGHTGAVYAIAYCPDGTRIATGSHDNSIKIWDTRTYSLEKSLQYHNQPIFALVYSPDGQLLASGSNDATIKIWNTRTYRLLRTLTGHTDCIRALLFSPDRKHLVSGSADNRIIVWDRLNYKRLYTCNEHTSAITSLEYTPNGMCLISESQDGKRNIWSTKKYALIRTEETEQSPHTQICGDDYTFSARGTEIFISDPYTKQLIQKLTGHTDAILTIAISSNKKYLASGSYDKTVRIWRDNTTELSQEVTGTKEPESLFKLTPQAMARSLDTVGKIEREAAPSNCVIS